MDSHSFCSLHRVSWLWCAAAALAIFGLSSGANARGKGNVQSVDIACDANSIVFDGPTQHNPHDEGDPADHPDYGASFVVQGWIYPRGTLAEHGVSSGLNPDGTPEFPDLVIGRWICQGWFIGADGIFTETGPFVSTTQTYDFDLANPGSKTLVSQGIELIDLDVPFRRAITGGSGVFQKVRGDVTQTAVGTNATGLFNFTFDFQVKPNARITERR